MYLQVKHEKKSKYTFGLDIQNQGHLELVLSNQEKDIEEDYMGSNMQNCRKKK